MRYWNEHYIGQVAPDFTTTPPTSTNGLSDDDWNRLFYEIQETLQSMYSRRHLDYKSNVLVQNFLRDWFNGDYGEAPGSTTDIKGRIFCMSRANNTTTSTLTGLANFLENNQQALETVLVKQAGVFSDCSYGDMVADLRDGKYNKDLKFRDKVKHLIGYIDYYRRLGSEYWPDSIAPDAIDSAISTWNQTVKDFQNNTAFEIPDKDVRLQRFKQDYTTFLDTLRTDETPRKEFIKHNANASSSNVSKQLETALNETNYDNTDSSDFLNPLYDDEKNLSQRFKKWKNDAYEDWFRRFVNPERGTRLFFSPYSMNIVKTLDKANVKPTSGIEGIVSQSQKILGDLAEKIGKSSTTYKHFDWFCKAMGEIKSQIPDAYEGALRNGAQLRRVVSALIAKAVKDDKIKQAKTALELLSVCKYTMMCSNTMNKINESLKDFKLLSDPGLPWNGKGNEGIQMVTGAIDGAIKGVIQLGAMAGTGLYNFIQHRRTKFNNDIRNNPILQEAYDKWRAEHGDNTNKLNQQQQLTQQLAAANANVDNILNTLNASRAAAGQPPLTRDTLGAFLKTEKDNTQAQLDAAHQRLQVLTPLQQDYSQHRQNRQAIYNLSSRISSIQRTRNTNLTQISQLQQQNQNTQHQIDSFNQLSSQIAAIDQQINILRTQKQVNLNDINQLQNQPNTNNNNNRRRKKRNRNNQTNSNSGQIRALQQQNTQIDASIAQLQQQQTNLQQQLQGISLPTLQQQLNTNNQQLATLNTQNNNLQARITQAANQINSLRQQNRQIDAKYPRGRDAQNNNATYGSGIRKHCIYRLGLQPNATDQDITN